MITAVDWNVKPQTKQNLPIKLQHFTFFSHYNQIKHSGKSVTIQESNHGSGVYMEHYAQYYVQKSSILLAGTGVIKNSTVACGSSSIKIDYSDYPKSLISRINDVFVFFSIKSRYSNILLKKHKLHLICLFCCNHTCYCVNMVSVMSASHYLKSVSWNHSRYQSRSSMYSRGLIPQNFAELALVPIVR